MFRHAWFWPRRPELNAARGHAFGGPARVQHNTHEVRLRPAVAAARAVFAANRGRLRAPAALEAATSRRRGHIRGPAPHVPHTGRQPFEDSVGAGDYGPVIDKFDAFVAVHVAAAKTPVDQPRVAHLEPAAGCRLDRRSGAGNSLCGAARYARPRVPRKRCADQTLPGGRYGEISPPHCPCDAVLQPQRRPRSRHRLARREWAAVQLRDAPDPGAQQHVHL